MPGSKTLKQVCVSYVSLMFGFPNIFTLPFSISPTTLLGIVQCPGREMSEDILQPPGHVMNRFTCKLLTTFGEFLHPRASKV